jgi:hypothetical protein
MPTASHDIGSNNRGILAQDDHQERLLAFRTHTVLDDWRHGGGLALRGHAVSIGSFLVRFILGLYDTPRICRPEAKSTWPAAGHSTGT